MLFVLLNHKIIILFLVSLKRENNFGWWLKGNIFENFWKWVIVKLNKVFIINDNLTLIVAINPFRCQTIFSFSFTK